MSGYLDSRKLGNVKGRIEYMTDENRQENIMDYYNTTDNEFWSMLAKESRERHKETKAGGKCCEARELIIGIPLNSNVTAKDICDTFKNRYGVECACAIHYNEKVKEKVKVKNKHCHLIFSERKKLSTPEVQEEKRALRTYYYDSTGHKCKKAEAVKVVEKGTILQKGTIRNFTEKNEHFKSQKFVYECKEMILKDLLKIDWSFEVDQKNKELAEKHIGKNNPKEEYIKKNNRLKAIVKDVCKAGDFIFESEKGQTLKEFKKNYEIKSFVTSKYEENENKIYDFVEEMQSIYKDRVRSEVKIHNEINEDVNLLKENDYIFHPVQESIISRYEEETKTREKPKVIEILKERLSKMVKRIEKLVHLQDFLYIERKNQIQIEQNKRTNKLTIKDNDYYIKQQKQKDDYELER
ncbi:MAG: hypothetical protein J6N78_04765 [Clostridia bacterium]|nr:hypothetical protein [Clostridia bacterium]